MRAESRGRITVFSGPDPMFNLKNLRNRIRAIKRKQVYLLGVMGLIIICAITAVIIWFKVVLKGYAN